MHRDERQSLRLLLLEDDARDAELIARSLGRADPTCTVQVVDNRAGFTRLLETFGPDAVISNSGGPGFRALDALELVRSHRPTIPVVLVSGALSPAGVECLKAGAADFVPKTDLARLGAAITGSIEQRAPLRKLSARQCTVLQRLAAGQSTRQIAQDLQISIKTVETHRAELMRRLGIKDLAGLVRFAVRVGLVSAAG
ncbi:MAG TPA: response regulator transcription factor [Gemmatimonadales bacterium]|nr:response regulator transcription factor [Gemmatimonadales bacterium]